MPVSIFSETELARLASFPEEIPSDDLIRAFTLTGADRDLVVIRRGAANRLGLALQLCALRYLGFVPRNLSAAPRSAACFVADQLEVSPDEIQSYARREQTRRQHFTEVREHLGFSMLRSRDLEELEAWLVERVLEHDAPKVLFRLARERLRTERLVFPAPDRIVRLVSSARGRAQGENVHPGRARDRRAAGNEGREDSSASPEPLERGAAMSSRTARHLLERGECRLALSDRGKDLDDVG